MLTNSIRLASALVAGVSLIALGASPALAADLTVTGTRTTPITTSNANSGPGNVIVDGIVDVPSGTAVTIDSNHSLTVNAGRTVKSDALSNGTGVAVVAPASGIAGTITNNGQITVTGTDDDDHVGTGNVGLLIGGAGTFTGNVVSGKASSVFVGGHDSFGVSVASRLQGTLGLATIVVDGDRSTAVSVTGEVSGLVNLVGSIEATGANSTGVAISGLVTGTLTNAGAIATGQGETRDDDDKVVPAVAGRASVLISGTVAGGFLNDRFYVDSDGVRVPPASVDPAKHTLITGTIAALGGAPALLVSPGAAATANAVIGNVGTGDDAYGVVNRGSIRAFGRTAGRSVDVVRIVGGNGFDALLGGGFHNVVNGAITAGTINATAVGIRVGDGGVVPEVRNGGSIDARADVATGATPGAGGSAYGIRVDAGGAVDRIVNSGTIRATASGDNQSAIGIYAVAGLQSIANTGTIRAVAGTGTNIARVAIDTSPATTPLTLTNSGTIDGDIRLGSGNDVVTMTAGSMTGNVAFGAGANQLNLSGGTLRGGLSATGGTLGAALSGTGVLDLTGQNGASFSTLSAAATSRIVVDVGAAFTGIDVSGAASFTGASTIELNVRDLLNGNQTINVLNAAGGITTDHAATLVNAASAPFIYAASNVVVSANSIDIDLRRKSAAELGLNAAYGAVYDASITALASEQALTSAVNDLRDQASVAAAIRQLTPTTYGTGGVRALLAAQDAGFGVLSHRLEGIRRSIGRADTARVEAPNLGLWVQQVGHFFKGDDSADDPGFSGNAYGLAGGGDILVGDRAGVGLGLSYISSEVDPDGLAEKPLVVSSLQIDAYGTVGFGGFFAEANAGIARNDYQSERVVSFGGLDRTATARFNGTQISANATIGYELSFGRLRLTPSNSISYLHVKQDGYTEEGAGAINLDVEGNTVDVVRNTLELGLGYGIKLGEGELRLDARGAWLARVSGDRVITVGRFTGGGDAFTLESASPADNGWRAGGGIGYVGGHASLALNYDRESSSGFSNNAVSVTLAAHF